MAMNKPYRHDRNCQSLPIQQRFAPGGDDNVVLNVFRVQAGCVFGGFAHQGVGILQTQRDEVFADRVHQTGGDACNPNPGNSACGSGLTLLENPHYR